MRDLTIRLENRPGALAEMGEALGGAGVSVEGGGAFLFGDAGIAHFLFEDGAAARIALEAKGMEVLGQGSPRATIKARPTRTIGENRSADGESGCQYRSHLQRPPKPIDSGG